MQLGSLGNPRDFRLCVPSSYPGFSNVKLKTYYCTTAYKHVVNFVMLDKDVGGN